MNRRNNTNSTKNFTVIAVVIIIIYVFLFFSIAQNMDALNPNTPVVEGGLFIGTVLLLAFIRMGMAASKPNPRQELTRPEHERKAREQKRTQAARKLLQPKFGPK